MGTRSNAFDRYLQAARSIEKEKTLTVFGVEIAKYLDLLQEEFRPVQPRCSLEPGAAVVMTRYQDIMVVKDLMSEDLRAAAFA